LEEFAKKYFKTENIRLSPATAKLTDAMKWFKAAGGNLDGIVAKRRDLPYRSGQRDGMQKLKHHRTADCVVGGFRYASAGKTLGSLLLGLYDDGGKLNHVGFTSSFNATARKTILDKIKPLIGGEGFTGQAPGGPSRWSTKRSTEWVPLKPKLVIEVGYDHFTGGRFRHGTQLLRWRPEKSPKQCKYDQVDQRGGRTLKLLERRAS
jgi:ATP-dependent DNA ligase